MEQLKMYLCHRNDRVHRIKPNSKIPDAYFQNPRWQLIAVLEQLAGIWPHQSKLKQYVLHVYYFFIAFTIFSSMMNELTDYVGVDIGMVIECWLIMLIFLCMVIKLLLASTHQRSRGKIYERIAEHFETIDDPEEAAVLSEGAEEGFKYALAYMGVICFGVGVFAGVPVARSFYDYLINHHNELDIQMPILIDYGFDHKKYWYLIVIDFTSWMFICLLIQVTCDLSFILQTRHVEALFKIVGIRLGRASDLLEKSESEVMDDDAADESYSLISSAIDMHSVCFEVVKLIETSYTTSWFMILLISTAGFGAGIHLITLKLHDPIETFRFALTFVAVVFHFQMVFSQGQRIINAAESVSKVCCASKWYGLPKKSCKLLPMMLIRTSIPCTLTGAKLFPLSMESFSKMLKAGLSYYTVFKSRE